MDSLDTFRERFDALEQQTAQLQQQTHALEAHTHMVERRLRWWRGTALLVLVLVSWPLSGAMTQAQEEDISGQALTLAQRVAALEAKLKYLTTFKDGSGRPTMRIAGANLRVVNGTGSTTTVNGLGNLIVGYNEPHPVGSGVEDIRTGSHNVVVGREHNFSRFGGLVVGFRNEISGDFASVTGGGFNTASGTATAVSGGYRNQAIGGNGSVCGGFENFAIGVRSTVSGGAGNGAFGVYASVSGGGQNQASGDAASVSGGVSNTASDFASSVSGGANRTAPGERDWVAGSLFEDF